MFKTTLAHLPSQVYRSRVLFLNKLRCDHGDTDGVYVGTSCT